MPRHHAISLLEKKELGVGGGDDSLLFLLPFWFRTPQWRESDNPSLSIPSECGMVFIYNGQGEKRKRKSLIIIGDEEVFTARNY